MLSERIMVVDDDDRVHQSLKTVFQEYEIVGFYNGEDAIKFMQTPNDVCVILLDVYMKGIDGIAVLKEIKKLAPEIGVIIMTAYSSKDVILESLRGHADDYVEKPFEILDLRTKVKKLIKDKVQLRSWTESGTDKVERIKRYVSRNYNDVSLDKIAQELCLSPKYVSRLFSTKSDKGFRDMKVEAKMSKARNLLANSSYDITQIAHQLGYKNPESLMRIFKKVHGITPSKYREQNKTEDQE